MKAKYTLLIISIFYFISTILFSNPSYKMEICDIEVLSNTKIQACVYIENIDDELIVTSYQCALSINQNIDLSSLSLSYVEESSELFNEPNLFVGVGNIDGPTELTFVSYIGHDIISSRKRIGTFVLEGNLEINQVNLLDIQWDFDGTIATIITGEDFQNITDPTAHISIFPSIKVPHEIAKVNIVNSETSAVYGDMFTDKQLYDGITSSNTDSYTEGRWAVEGFPQWVTIDFGEDTYIDNVKLDPYGSEDGINYVCEFYSGNYENKSFILVETTQTGSQWSQHNLGGITTRYLTIVVTGSDGNTWCDFWELEIYGYNSTTSVDQDIFLEEKSEIPSEFSISQNYPNPFNPSTKVKINMKDHENVNLNIYNLLGEKVACVIDQELSAGTHEIQIDGSKLASGMYIYQVVMGNGFTATKKMQLMK